MKLQRFTAANNQKAILMIHETLGADALIYSTHSTPDGVEILAGLPQNDVALISDVKNEQLEVQENFRTSSHVLHADVFEKPLFDPNLLIAINSKLLILDEQIKKISKKIDNKFIDYLKTDEDEQSKKRKFIFHYLHKLGFKEKFCHQFIIDNSYLLKNNTELNNETISQALLSNIKTEDIEIVNEKNIYALIGPTGSGKTTTIIKIANRYLEKFDNKSIGFIVTSNENIHEPSYLHHYSQQKNIDLAYATTPRELTNAILSMKKKNLILIDTKGINHRDSQKVIKMLELLESQGGKISAYMTLPCTVQESILDEIARAFNTAILHGCILTKGDECISIAPAVSVSVNYKMKIAYICNGQNINTDLVHANSENVLFQITQESLAKKVVVEENLSKNLARIESM